MNFEALQWISSKHCTMRIEFIEPLARRGIDRFLVLAQRFTVAGERPLHSAPTRIPQIRVLVDGKPDGRSSFLNTSCYSLKGSGPSLSSVALQRLEVVFYEFGRSVFTMRTWLPRRGPGPDLYVCRQRRLPALY